MKKFLQVLAPVLVVFGCVLIAGKMVAAKPQVEKKPKEQRVVSLFVDEVQSDTVKLSVNSYGEVAPKTEIDLTAMVAGQIIEISDEFSEGGKFSKGDTLLKIDNTEYKAALSRAEAQVATAKVRLEEEIANSKIKEQQWKRKNSGKPTEYALNIPQINEAKALLKAAKADLLNAKLNLSRTVVVAPFDGRVMSEHIGMGQYITPSTVLGQIFATNVIQVRLPLTDSQLNELNLPIGFEGNHSTSPKVTFSAYVGNKKHQWDGRIVRTNAAIDNDTRLVYALAEVTDPYNENSPMPMAVGLYVDANIESNNSLDTMIIPRLALHNNDKVYVINDDVLEIRTVEVLATSEKLVHIAGGVSVGEKVVTSTVPSVVDGMKVQAVSREADSLQAQTDLIANNKQG